MTSHYCKKLKFILFPPTQFPCGRRVASTCSNYKRNRTGENFIADGSKNNTLYCPTNSRLPTLTMAPTVEQNRPSRYNGHRHRHTVETQSSYHTALTHSRATTQIYTNSQLTQDSCPTTCVDALQDDRSERPLSIHDFLHHSNATLSSSRSSHRRTSLYDHYSKQYIASILRKWVLPFKTHYELEWPVVVTDESEFSSSKVWLPLDSLTANGVERVRRLGFSDLDVRLDDALVKYIHKLIGDNSDFDDSNSDIVVQIFFDNQIKQSVMPCDEKDEKKARLLRLRRVHWWSVRYHLARTYLPIEKHSTCSYPVFVSP